MSGNTPSTNAAGARLAEASRQAQKLEVLGQLAAGVNHDFNNILQIIRGAVDVLRDEAALTAESRGLVTLIEEATERGASLTQHLLSYLRDQPQPPRLVDPVATVAGLCGLLRRTLRGDIVVTTRLQASIGWVRVDPGQLETALMNLAINASDAMPHGGTIRVEVGAASDEPELGGTKPGRGVVISVTDDGAGMAPDIVARAFEPFFTTKGVRGTGLGLAMVRAFARQSGGDVWVTSTPGAGTQMAIWLPECAAPATPPAANPPPRRHGVGRLLLVDNSRDVLATMQLALTHAGFTVRCADTSRHAVALLRSGERFDALVTDYMMPGLNGVELVRRGRTIQPGLPALLLSGYAAPIDELADLPDLLLLRKPVSRDQLVERITDIIAAAAAQRRALHV